MSSTTKLLALTLFLLSFSSHANEYKPSFLTKTIKDIELRSRFDSNSKSYSHALRFSLSSIKSGAIFEALELERKNLQSESLFVEKQLLVESSRSKEEFLIAKNWNQSLKKAYRDYRQFLKSNPEKEKSSLDLKAEKLLSFLLLNSSEQNTNIFQASTVQNLSISTASVKEAGKEIDDRSFYMKTNLKDQFKANSNLIRFLEIRIDNDENFNEFSSPEYGFSINLPLGFTGKRKEARLKFEIAKAKARVQAFDKKFRLVKSFDNFKQSKHLFIKTKSLLKTKAQVRRIIKSISVTPVEILQLYLDTIDLHMASSKLKHDALLHYNEHLFLSGAPTERYFSL